MKLGVKLFLAFSLVLGVLFVVGVLSLRALDRLVAVNRDITTRTLPAVRHVSAAHDAMPGLARLEGRMLILRDAAYAAAWRERMAQVREDLSRLSLLLAAPSQMALLSEAWLAFDGYEQVVAREQQLVERGQRRRALEVAQRESSVLLEQVEVALGHLIDEIHGAARSAQREAARLESRTWTGVLVALGAAVGLAFLAAAVIVLRLTRSLRALSIATSAVATGSFREPVKVEGRDEVAALGLAFNRMAERLQEIDRLKETFLAAVSHELRSPLTSIREAAHLLRDGVPGGLNAKQGRLVGIVEKGADRLLRLVNQILDLSRLRAGMLTVARMPLAIDRVVAKAVEELRPQAEDAGLVLKTESAGGSFQYLGDEDRLVQVVVNLVSNAIRFTPSGGLITVRVIDVGPEIEIQVEDTGVGIPAAALPHIFGWYEQAHRDRGGTGLGLPIVRGLVTAHGGRVTVESQEGKGSRFTVLLPRGGVE
jgi:signal transduction histidine kinase